jgi:hypothetical protein
MMRFQCSLGNGELCGTLDAVPYTVEAESFIEGTRRMADHWVFDHSGLTVVPVPVDVVVRMGAR